jgi:hypothetical protein
MATALGELELELEGLGEFEDEYEGNLEGEFESEFESELESELELESALEGEFESSGPNPVSRVYPDAMMEHMGLAAMEAETEYEAAEHFLPLVPLVASKILPMAAKAAPRIAAKVLPHVARVVSHVTPRLTHGVTHITHALHRNPQTRHLVRTIPAVARRAVTRIARHAAAGHPVTPHHAARILRHEHHRMLRNPKLVHAALRHAHKMDRRYHRLGGLPVPARGAPAQVAPPHLHDAAYLHGVAPHARHLAPHLRGAVTHPTHPATLAHRYGAPHLRRLAGMHPHACPTCGSHLRQGRTCCCC